MFNFDITSLFSLSLCLSIFLFLSLFNLGISILLFLQLHESFFILVSLNKISFKFFELNKDENELFFLFGELF